jgi:hypothetical protein
MHPLDRPAIPAPPVPPRQPGRSLADMLQAFMEESNIRWGEILAAMLIVVSSVGLVISLRSKLQQIPYFPAILFTLFTVSFHGAGLYTLRRWKLHAVSRMILIISLLLVPLTFCGAIALGESRPAGGALFWLVLAVGAVLFTWVAYSASREVVGGGAWPLAIGVVGPSLAQVLVQHFPLVEGEFWRLNAVLAAPLACFLAASGWQLVRARARRLALMQLQSAFERIGPVTSKASLDENRLNIAAKVDLLGSCAVATALVREALLGLRFVGRQIWLPDEAQNDKDRREKCRSARPPAEKR